MALLELLTFRKVTLRTRVVELLMHDTGECGAARRYSLRNDCHVEND